VTSAENVVSIKRMFIFALTPTLGSNSKRSTTVGVRTRRKIQGRVRARASRAKTHKATTLALGLQGNVR